MRRCVTAVALALAVIALSACGRDHGPRDYGRGANADDTSGEIQGVATPACAPVHYGGKGSPRFLIASSLPLQGGLRGETLQMSEGIRLVLEQHGYRAGGFTVGYQACDDATAAAGQSVPARCRSNGRAFARTPQVIGVIGSFFSACTAELLPVLNRATRGGLVVISPASSYVGLTKAAPGTLAGDPARFYPARRRNFVRVVATDDVQGAANELLAEKLGVKRAFVLHDGELFGTGVATMFRRVANRRGLKVVGFRAWDPRARSYTALARDVRRAQADVVFFGGLLFNNGARLIQDLRKVTGPGVQFLGPDGMGPPAALVQRAGEAAEGMTLTKPDIPLKVLGPAGRRFSDALAERTGKGPCCYTMHAAQAAELLLGAIAGSDGSRRSVTRRVQQAKIRDGLLGSFSFDAAGDTTLRRIFIHRIRGATLTFEAMVTPPASLVTR